MLRWTPLISCLLAAPAMAQTATLRPARPLNFPSAVDSNSPALWLNGQLEVYNSTGMGPVKSLGFNQFHLSDAQVVTLGPSTHRPYWIEATWTDADGTIFAWYHHEPAGLCGAIHLTAPEIGALVSYDGGNSFLDMGIILESGYPINCYSQNGYFAGGNGDFSVLLGKNQKYFYFFSVTTLARRMPKAWRWHACRPTADTRRWVRWRSIIRAGGASPAWAAQSPRFFQST